jgi:hypothetical protein
MGALVTGQITPNNRTKIGNGRRLFPRPKFGGPDMRLPEGRRLAELCADLIGELGREPTSGELTSIKIAARIVFKIENDDLGPGETFTGMSSEYRRIRDRLGLDGGRAEPDGPSLADLLRGDAT